MQEVKGWEEELEEFSKYPHTFEQVKVFFSNQISLAEERGREEEKERVLKRLETERWAYHELGNHHNFTPEQIKIINELCMGSHNNGLDDIIKSL